MDVHQAARIGRDQHGGHDPHPARHHHQVHAAGRKGGRYLLIELLPLGMVAMVMEAAGDAKAFRPLAGSTGGVVHHQLHHLGLKDPAPAGQDQGLEVAAFAGGHHPEPQDSILPGPAFRCFARRVWHRPLDRLLWLASVV